MNFFRKEMAIHDYSVNSRLDSGRRPWRQVYLVTRWSEGEKKKYVLVAYDHKLSLEAGVLTKDAFPREIENSYFYDGDYFDVSEARWYPSAEFFYNGRLYLYVVYDYVEGVRLDKFMKRKKRAKLGVDFMIDLCEAINNVNVVTRGGGFNALSPENVIVKNLGDGKYKPYLIGYANVYEPTKRKKICDVELLDHRFRAPETFVGGFSKYSDIYALGVMFCYILGGDDVLGYSLDDLRAMTEAQRRKLIKKFRYTSFENVCFPAEEYYEIVSKALEERPEDRYESVLDMLHKLQHTSDELREIDKMFDKLQEREVANKKSLLDNKANKNSFDSDDFDKLLDDFIASQLNEVQDMAQQTLDEELSKDSDNDDYDDTSLSSCDDDDAFDWNKRDDGSLSVNVSIAKRKGNGFADVAGMLQLKQLLKRNFIDIVRHRDKAKKYNIQPSNGILLYGPPGCGKTYIAEKMAEEANLNFVLVKPSDLGSTYVHGSQTKISDLFKKAEEKAPSLLCFDEFDALVPARTEDTSHHYLTEVNEFLVQLNNCASRGVYVLAMTNNINLIDKAVLRKGRIDEVIYVPEPDLEARIEMFKLNLAKCDMAAENIDLQRLADMTKGYSSSDIAYIILEASRVAFRESIEIDDWVEVTQENIEAVIKRTASSISSSDLRHYENMRDEFVTKKKQIEIRPRIGFAV